MVCWKGLLMVYAHESDRTTALQVSPSQALLAGSEAIDSTLLANVGLFLDNPDDQEVAEKLYASGLVNGFEGWVSELSVQDAPPNEPNYHLLDVFLELRSIGAVIIGASTPLAPNEVDDRPWASVPRLRDLGYRRQFLQNLLSEWGCLDFDMLIQGDRAEIASLVASRHAKRRGDLVFPRSGITAVVSDVVHYLGGPT